MSRGSAATIRDVARAANVSVSTVSHVLSGKRPTSVSTRRRVEAAVARLGYRPNAVAQSLVWRRSFALGLVIPDIANPYFPALARGVEDGVRARGYTLVLGNSDYDMSREVAYLELLRARQLAGAIYCVGDEASSTTAELCRAAGAEGLPIVLVGSRTPGLTTVCADNRLGGRLAAEHLLALGHDALGLVSALPLDAAIMEREAGFRDALVGAGRLAPPAGIPTAYGDHQIVGGRRALAELLERAPGITAVFVLNDLMALGALDAARAVGRRVPQELSIVGFDDIPFAALASPPLTTVRQPIRQLGERAAELLLGLIDEARSPEARRRAEPSAVTLPTELVVRGSTAPVGRGRR